MKHCPFCNTDYNAPVYVECTGGSADEHMVVRLFEALKED